ncbi:MAG TPA: hypothetical protein DGH68_01935 [Bacteroidetes bacterium]|jgi:hypothetical protein|nr:hypothetical protein [Bacteroidota bacterium]
MSKTNTSELDLLKFVFQGVSPSWNAAANLFASLHAADPGETGDQSTSESTYGSYTRVTISRSTSAWTTSSTTACVNLASINFPLGTAGAASPVTYMGIGTSFSGAGTLLYSGALASQLAVGVGVTPSFDTGSVTITED